MASELRVNTSTNRSGLGTITYTDTGAIVSGIVTATSFSGNITGNITGPVTGDVTGNVTGNVTGTASNASGATGDFSIADKIIHTGDTNTAIRFPGADVFAVETVGTERLRCDVDGVKLTNGRFYSAGTFAYIDSSSTSNASLTLKKTTGGADAIDYLQLRNNANDLKLKISGDGIIFTPDVLASHEGDTNTKLRFPAADTFSVETAGQQNVQVDGTRVLLKSPSGTNTTVRLQHQGNSGYGDIILDRTVNAFIIDNDPSNASNNQSYFSVKNKGTENLRIASDGDQTFTSTTGNAQFTFKKGDSPTGEETVFARFDRNGTVIGGVGGAAMISGGESGNNIMLATVNNGHVVLGTGNGGVATARLRITQGGKIGMGIDSPYLDKVCIKNDVSAGTHNWALHLLNGTHAGDSRVGLAFQANNNAASNTWDGAGIYASNDGSTGACHTMFGTVEDGAFTERLCILSSGDVRIGTTSWSYPKPLNVQGSSGAILALSNYDTTSYAADTNTSIEFRINTGNTGNQNGACEIRAFKENGTNGNNARGLSFWTAGNGGSPSEKLTITSDGTLEGNGMFIFGNPSGYGGVSSTQGCRITGGNGSHPACLSFDGGGSPTLELGSKSGEAIIGSNSYQSSPINFKSGMGLGTLSGGTTRFQIQSNGNIGAPTGNNIYSASDERLKENMIELTDGLSKVEKLKPISFTWKEGWDVNLDGKKEYGFGAQTTEEVDELLVEPFSTDDIELNGETIENPLRVNEKYIIPLLVKAVQELSAKVASLESS